MTTDEYERVANHKDIRVGDEVRVTLGGVVGYVYNDGGIEVGETMALPYEIISIERKVPTVKVGDPFRVDLPKGTVVRKPIEGGFFTAMLTEYGWVGDIGSKFVEDRHLLTDAVIVYLPED